MHYSVVYSTLEEAVKEALKQASPFSAYYTIVFWDPMAESYFVASDYELIWPERLHPERRAWLEERLPRSQEVWSSDDKFLG